MTTTTDPQDELFDVLDADGNQTGIAKPRGEVHRDGDWHRGLHIWVYGFDPDGTAFMLFQRRSMTKDTWPGKLDVAVGGHYRSGETLRDTLRETEEEIGLTAGIEELVPLGVRFIEDFGATFIDRELDDVFALRSDQPLTGYVLHPDEVDSVVSVALADLKLLFDGDREVIPAFEVHRLGTPGRLEITLDDFAGDRADYRDAVVASVLKLAAGITPEPFYLKERRGPE
jgi:isopentenyldiphosphate isomerase